MRGDKEKWLESTMQDMDEDMKHHRQGDFFKKMKWLTNSKVTPEGTILDEHGNPLHTPEEMLALGKRHFEGVQNVQGTAAEEAMASLDDQVDTPEVTGEEVERVVKKLHFCKAAGEDSMVPELLKNGGTSLIDWLWELLLEGWKSGKVPEDWKSATLVPLYKKRRRQIYDNYQGISLLSVPSS